jgi:hypothetical protein
MGVREDLDAAWAKWQTAELYKKWRRSNPGEATKLDVYRAGGLRPVLATATGAALVFETAAWIASGAPVVPPPSVPVFTGWDVGLRPAFSSVRTVVCTTRAQFSAAWADLRPGDKLDVRGVAFTGQTEFRKRLPDFAEIHLDAGCTFRHTGDYLAAWVPDSSHLRFYGGDISNTGNHGTGQTRAGLRVEASDNVTWWDFKIHDCEGGGLGVWESRTGGPTAHHLDLRGEIWNCGLNYEPATATSPATASVDPHSEKGTGIHGCYLGASNGWLEDSTFILKVHDQPTGAAIQHGPNTRRNVVELDARRITFPAQSQVAGCAFSVWRGGVGPGQSVDNRVRWLYAEDCAGRAVEADGGISTSTVLGYTVEYARKLRTNLDMPGNAPDPTDPYKNTAGSVVYQDCS